VLLDGRTSGSGERGFEAVLQKKELQVATGSVERVRDRERVRAACLRSFVQDPAARPGHRDAQLRREACERPFRVGIGLRSGVI
jgi:hypothetical protein